MADDKMAVVEIHRATEIDGVTYLSQQRVIPLKVARELVKLHAATILSEPDDADPAKLHADATKAAAGGNK